MALYLNDPHSVQDLCKTVLLNTKPSSFLYLTPNTLAIENSPSNFSLKCPTQQTTTTSSCSSCVLEIPNKCTLITSGYYFPASCPQTDIISNQSHTITHSFTLAIIQEFFASPDCEHIKADTSLAQQITLRLPTFLSTSNSSDNDEATDKLLVKDLNSAINDVKTGQILFKSTKDIIQEQLDNLQGRFTLLISSQCDIHVCHCQHLFNVSSSPPFHNCYSLNTPCGRSCYTASLGLFYFYQTQSYVWFTSDTL